MVGKGVKYLSRSASISHTSTGNVTDYCEHGFRTVYSRGIQNARKLLGDEGNSSSNSRIQGLAQGQVNTDSLRQYHSGGSHQETGWNTLDVLVRPTYSIIRIVHIPRNSTACDIHSGGGGTNVMGDQLSKANQVQLAEWTLAANMVREILRLYPDLQVDLVTTRWDRQLDLFVSPFPEEQAWAVDALSISWEGLVAYVYPPTILIRQVLNKVGCSSVVLCLAAPKWKAQA